MMFSNDLKSYRFPSPYMGKLMNVLLGSEAVIFHVSGESDNHYTTETSGCAAPPIGLTIMLNYIVLLQILMVKLRAHVT